MQDSPLRLLLVARESVTGLLGERLVVSRLGGSGGVVGLSLDHVDSLLEVLFRWTEKRRGMSVGTMAQIVGGKQRDGGLTDF